MYHIWSLQKTLLVVSLAPDKKFASSEKKSTFFKISSFALEWPEGETKGSLAVFQKLSKILLHRPSQIGLEGLLLVCLPGCDIFRCSLVVSP